MSLPEPRGGAPSDCLLAEVWSTQRSDVKPIQCARLKHAATRRSLPWTKNCNSTSCFVSCFSFFFIVFTFVTRLSWLSTDLDFGVDETLVFLYYRSQEVSIYDKRTCYKTLCRRFIFPVLKCVSTMYLY